MVYPKAAAAEQMNPKTLSALEPPSGSTIPAPQAKDAKVTESVTQNSVLFQPGLTLLLFLVAIVFLL